MTAKRPCLDQCGRLTTSTRCDQCERKRDRGRGTRTARGYGTSHTTARAAHQRRMDAGYVYVCWRCEAQGRPHDVDPHDWQLGHCDDDRATYHGPECAAGNAATNGRRTCPHPSHPVLASS